LSEVKPLPFSSSINFDILSGLISSYESIKTGSEMGAQFLKTGNARRESMYESGVISPLILNLGAR
jgi:hypothetical protein